MQQVDFYILNTQPRQSGLDPRLEFCCRLLDKACQSAQKVYVHADDQQTARHFDELLWVFRDTSFVAHELATASASPHAPVLIGWQTPPPGYSILLNLTAGWADFFTRFSRLLEVVDQDPARLAASRERFKHYRELGIEPNVNRM